MVHEILHDPVDVRVDFHGKRVHPKRLRWGNNIYDITQIHLIHPAREGTKRIYYFSASDTTNFFKLRFDTDSLEWHLVEFYSD